MKMVFMKTTIRELGTYTVAIDTVPPKITPLNPKQWGSTGRIVFKAKDEETGISSYRGTIDGKYALFGKPNSISGNLVCKLDPNHVKKGRQACCGNDRNGWMRESDNRKV